MKVILVTDIPKIGQKGDVKDFNDGFAQNVLLSKGKAILATPKALSDLALKKMTERRKKQKENEEFLSILSILNSEKIVIKVKTNEKGNLFQSVTSKDISNEINKQKGLLIDESNIQTEHLKSIGNHKIILKKGNLKGECKIIIESL